MEKFEVKSSNILGIEYNRDTHTLFVTFKGGSVYRYNDVPRVEVVNMVDAESAGAYLHAHIKPKYHTARVR